jgi:predicted nucleic acid-binding protein
LIKKIEGAPRGKYVTFTNPIPNTSNNSWLNRQKPKRKKLVGEIVNSITSLPGLKITPLTAEDRSKAISLMEEYNLDYEDALHLTAALRNKAKEIISKDQDFDKTPLRRLFV